MYYCTKLNLELYSRGDYGLYKSYSYDRHLFNLLSRTCLAFFTYEEPSIKKPKLHVLDDIAFYRALLTPRLRKALETQFPHELELDLPPPHDSIAYLRLLQWKKHYRGRLRGNKVQFRSALTKEEDEILVDFIRGV